MPLLLWTMKSFYVSDKLEKYFVFWSREFQDQPRPPEIQDFPIWDAAFKIFFVSAFFWLIMKMVL